MGHWGTLKLACPSQTCSTECASAQRPLTQWRAKLCDRDTSLTARVKDLEDENECPKKMDVEEKLKVEIAAEYLVKK